MEAVSIKATSNILEINTNDALTITNLEGKEETYKVTGITHYYHDKSEQGSKILKKEPALYSMYSNELHLIPNTMPYAMKVKEPPKAQGITTGVVIGNSDDIESERNTIVVDEYGRVRVQFASSVIQGRYDEETFNNDNKYTHSCFLRYASPVSSNHSGFIAVPRVGDEVIISFIDGEPDRPVITGCLYNRENPALIQDEIISNKHKTSLTSKTVGKGEQGRNELTMSNLPGKEQIYLKAEKDYEELVQHDYSQTILNNKTSSVKGSHTENILQAHIQNIAGLKDVNVGGEYLTVVALSKDTAVGLSNTLNVGAENTLRVAGDNKELINGDFELKIGKNKNEQVTGNIILNSEGYKHEQIEQGIHIGSNDDIKLTCLEEISLHSNSMSLISDSSLSISSKDHITINGVSHDCSISETYKIFSPEYNIQANKSMVFEVGGALFSIEKDKVIIKLDKVEFEFSDSGLKINNY